MSKQMPKKGLIAVAVVGVAAVVANFGVPAIAESQFQEQFVAPMEGLGFEVHASDIGFANSGNGVGIGLGADLIRLSKGGSVIELSDVGLASHTITFQSAVFMGPDGNEAAASGQGNMQYRPGSLFSLSVDDVVSSDPRLAASSMAGIDEVDIDMSHREASGGLESDLAVSLDGMGKFLVSTRLNDVDVWSAKTAEQVQNLLSGAKLERASLEFTDAGGFDQFVETMALSQGIPEKDAKEYLVMGVSQSVIPDSYKATMEDFVKSPGSITAKVAPKNSDGDSLTVAQIGASFEHLRQGFIREPDLLALFNLELSSQPK